MGRGTDVNREKSERQSGTWRSAVTRTISPALILMQRAAAIVLPPALLLVGLWIFGGRVTDNFRVSMLLTGAWVALLTAAIVLVAWRYRGLAVPVIASFAVTATLVGGYLGLSTFRDRVVSEEIATAAPGSGNRLVARGPFTSGAHDTSGTASVVRLASGTRVLTLDLRTDPGPDLRVYLAAGATGVDEKVDLGGLKGNRGTQQYAIPASVDTGRFRRVVIWCRAFSVNFGEAVLS